MSALGGKVALVTGASSGIGAAVATALAGQGAAVALAARRVSELEQLAESITATGGSALALPLDVTDISAVFGAVATTEKELGGLDILVNCAGLMLNGPVLETDPETWRAMLDVNTFGSMLTARACAERFVSQGSGHIVQISSTAGRIVGKGTAPYNASKWAITAFCDALRLELFGRGVRMTVLEPGAVATPLVGRISHEATRMQTEQWMASIEPLQPHDVAAAALYALLAPPHVNVNEVVLRPMGQER